MTNRIVSFNNGLSEDKMKMSKDEFKNIQKNGYVIQLTKQANLKNSGVSFDYMARLQRDIDAGIFVDKDNNGFTNKEKVELSKKFQSIFTNHGYNTDFTHMKAGEKYAITYNEYVDLAKAAGYELVYIEPVHDDTLDITENKSDEKNELQTVNKEVKTAESEFIDYFQNDEELAGASDSERIEIMANRIKDINNQIANLEQTTETYTTRKFLMFGGKTKVRELPQNIINDNKQKIEQLEAEKDKLKKYEVYARNVYGQYNWHGPFTPHNAYDENGNVLVQHNTYYKTKAVDPEGNIHKVIGVKVFKKLMTKSLPDYEIIEKYYPVDVQKVGGPKTGGIHWQIVPDLEHELVDYKKY